MASNGKKPASAEDVLAAILRRHAKDVCVPECKTGRTLGDAHHLGIIDLWAMRRLARKER